ncbi:MAG: acyl-CoA dehydrogenase family protein [Myxococcota bacterium]
MHFGLSEEQELLQETVRGFAAGECPADVLRKHFDAATGFDAELWRGLAEIGVAGLAIPEAYGGAGMEWLDLALVAEIVGEGGLPVPLLGHALAARAIALGGSDAQKEKWLPALASGEAIGAVAFAEEGDAWEPETFTARVANGVLTGRKKYATDANEANLFVVGVEGGGLAVVERGASGFAIERVGSIDHTRQLGDLAFANTPCEPLANSSIDVARKVRDAGLVLLAADAYGAAARLVAITNEYAKSRKQFGQPIAQFQSVKHQLADLATQHECARGLLWYAGHAIDHLPKESMRQAALAKSHICDVAAWIGREAIELHGGLGFTWECDVHIHLKRVMFDRSYLGTPEHHRRRIALQEGW